MGLINKLAIAGMLAGAISIGSSYFWSPKMPEKMQAISARVNEIKQEKKQLGQKFEGLHNDSRDLSRKYERNFRTIDIERLKNAAKLLEREAEATGERESFEDEKKSLDKKLQEYAKTDYEVWNYERLRSVDEKMVPYGIGIALASLVAFYKTRKKNR